MKKILSLTATAVVLQGFAFVAASHGLNIVVTNDDSHETANIQQLKVAL